MLDAPAIIDGKEAGTLGDHVDEALTVIKALMDLYVEGDGAGQPFTFPIPTVMLTRHFDWSGRRWGDLVDRIFQAVALRGACYFLNGYVADVEALYAMCCRLTIDAKKALVRLALPEERRNPKGLRGSWAMPDATGSIGVITINLPRVAALSKGEWDRLEELLLERLEIAREILRILRERYEKSLKAGLMPLTKHYLGGFWGHYSTFGLIGLPEAAANFLRDPRLWSDCDRRRMREAIDFEKRVVAFVRNYAVECESEDGYLYLSLIHI